MRLPAKQLCISSFLTHFAVKILTQVLSINFLQIKGNLSAGIAFAPIGYILLRLSKKHSNIQTWHNPSNHLRIYAQKRLAGIPFKAPANSAVTMRDNTGRPLSCVCGGASDSGD